MSNRFGYNSARWIRQDWRFIVYSGEDGRGMKRFKHDGKCGKKGGKTATGKTRLCLPQKVILELKKTRQGRNALHEQVNAKLRGSKGQNVQYNPIVLQAFQEFQRSDTFQDRPNKKTAQSIKTGKAIQIPLFDFDM
ncbi:MAG: hypothetical protein CL525_14320 [Aequorivita sp.]|nr:hypothetical protein [Aequorivita sp.]